MLLRELIAKPIIGLLAWVTLGIVYFWLIWDKDTQELWDKVVGTVVVNDRTGLTVQSPLVESLALRSPSMRGQG